MWLGWATCGGSRSLPTQNDSAAHAKTCVPFSAADRFRITFQNVFQGPFIPSHIFIFWCWESMIGWTCFAANGRPVTAQKARSQICKKRKTEGQFWSGFSILLETLGTKINNIAHPPSPLFVTPSTTLCKPTAWSALPSDPPCHCHAAARLC